MDGQLKESLRTFGAVVLQGPRAVGKTTTATEAARSSVRMDADPGLQAVAAVSPASVLKGDTPRLIDEWQLSPTLWNAVRHEVDDRGEPGQFILTGSATPADDITRHSGAGRMKRLTMRPMALSEVFGGSPQVPFRSLLDGDRVAAIGAPGIEEYCELLVRGGWPALIATPDRDAASYLSAYLDDVARVDLAATDTVVDPRRMEALMDALARNVATEVPVARLGREAQIADDRGLSEVTVRRYLDALTRVFVLEEQPAWRPHLRSKARVRVAPKWHFIDPSLALALLGATPEMLLGDLRTLGLMFESMCIRDLRVYASRDGGEVMHYRDGVGLEVDAIVQLRTGGWAAFEVKLGGQAAVDKAVSSLRRLEAKVSEEQRARLLSLNVLTAGPVSYTREDGVNVIALGHLG